MAVAFVVGGTTLGLTGSGTTLTISVNSGSATDRCITAQTRNNNNAVSSVAYPSGSALTDAGSGVGSTKMWRRVNQAANTNNLVVTMSVSYSVVWCTYAAWSGVDQTTPLAGPQTATGSSATPATASVTCPANGAVFGGCWGNYTVAGNPTITSGTLVGTGRDSGGGTVKAGGRRTDTGTLAWLLAGSTSWEAQGFGIQASATGSLVKTVDDLAQASVKTYNDLAIASVKTIDDLANV